MTTYEDRTAIAEYLAVLREAGPTLEPRLIEAFERLTPAQLDMLTAGLLEPADAPTATPAAKPRRNARTRTALALGVAFTLGLGGVAAASLAVAGPHEATTTSTTHPADIDILRGIDWAAATNW